MKGADPKRAVATAVERRVVDRRRRHWWSIWYGGIKPRRRDGRRLDDRERFLLVDWHASHLLPIAIAILLLCAGDAVLTLRLMTVGAVEANPLMAHAIGRDATVFAAAKMAMTGIGVVLLVAASRYRLFRALRVEIALYALLAGYTALIGYEFWLLQRIGPHASL
jgi:hypothetical protein